nr:unnamed protein product [Callosobruchus chinensis]
METMEFDDFPAIPPRNFYQQRQYLNLSATIEDLAASDTQNDVEIVIISPVVDPQTDEETFDDDVIQEEEFAMPLDIVGQVELHNVADDENEDIDEESIPLSVLREILVQGRERKVNQTSDPSWTQSYVNMDMPSTSGWKDRLELVKSDLENLSPVDIFEKLFDSDIYNHISQQTNIYSSQKNKHDFFVSRDDIKIFVGILLLTGYHKLPSERNYWSLDDDLKVPIVANAMSRNRFLEIKKYIHIADNDHLDKNDKMSKVRPLMNKLNQNFQQWGIFHENLAIDEAMVKFFGRHSSKQCIRGKPVRFRYKNWMICSPTGYAYGFDTYCRAKCTSKSEDSTLPLGSRVVLDLLDIVSVPCEHVVFIDNYFSSYGLLKLLKERGQRATGTVRDNRTKKCPLLEPKAFKKQERGYFQHMYDGVAGLLFVRWHDNSTVTMVTNYGSLEPLNHVKRWSKNANKKVQIPQPNIFSSYNASMGGVDLHDQSVNNYRISVRGKKWRWVLFTNAINMAVVNAWRLYQLSSEEPMGLLQFQRDIVLHYLVGKDKSQFRNRPPGYGPATVRKVNNGHYPEKVQVQLRCTECHMKARWRCEKCKTTLCIEQECFKKYHS